jgi:hypothetical protein
MGGLFVLGILGLWVWLAVWLSKKITTVIFTKMVYVGEDAGNASASHTAIRVATRLILALLLITLPFIDQLIAYPKWQQLCKTTGYFEWGPGMDEKKAFGRELLESNTTHETTIFPNIHVTYFSKQFKDAETGELVLNMPHSAYYKAIGMFYLPSDSGDNQAIFLPECRIYSDDKKVIDYLNQFNLKVVGSN